MFYLISCIWYEGENCVEKNESDLEEQPNTDAVTADEKNTEENSQVSIDFSKDL